MPSLLLWPQFLKLKALVVRSDNYLSISFLAVQGFHDTMQKQMKRIEKKPKLLLPLDYLSEATKQIQNAKKRIYLIGLSMFRDDTTRDFIDAIAAAARRGVDVHVAADFMTYSYATAGIKNLPLTYRSRSVRSTTDLKRHLTEAGAHFRWLGQHYGPLFMGRTHSKWLVVDDTVFSFGGVNVNREGFVDYNDYMLMVKDSSLANLLMREQLAIEKADRARRTSRNHKKKTVLGAVLIDGGSLGRSIIYDEAVKLARQADEILYVSQYCPTGRLAKILRTKSAQIYFNPIDNVDTKINRLIISLGRGWTSKNNLYKRKKHLHAKFIIFTMPDGSRRVITGSHNFVAASSRLGTRENALLTDDEKIIEQLEKFFHEEVE